MPDPNSPVPVIRLELDRMRDHVIHAMHAHYMEIDQEVAAHVKAVVDKFDFGLAIETETRRVIEDHIKRTVASAISSLFYDRGVQAQIQDSVRKALFGDAK